AFVSAQSLDTGFLGRVVDSSGAVVPGASVKIMALSTGTVHSVETSATGDYQVHYLTPGAYTIEIQKQGFQTDRRANIALSLDQMARVDFTLQLGAVQQTVSVTGAAPLLQTENATTGVVVTTRSIVDLPLNGRQFDSLGVLTPGVQVQNPSLISSRLNGSSIEVNGERYIWQQINVDGITMVNNRHNYVNLFPSVDAIQEFKVQTGNYSAEYGGNAGASTNIQLKSGTNQFHGDAFEFLRNNALDARDYFRPAPLPKNILKQNQFGATLGGPIRHDKTFFFLSYEGLREIGQQAGTAVVPTAAQKAGDFSSDKKPVVDPLTGQPFPNNIIPTGLLDPVSLNLLNKYMPSPNIAGTTNYAGASSGYLGVDQGIGRVDEYFNPRNQVFVHYIYADRRFPSTDLNPNFSLTGNYPIHNLAVQYVHIFSPTLINELRGGLDFENYTQLSDFTNTNFTIESLGITGMNVGGPNGRPLRKDEEGFPEINVSGYLNLSDNLASSNLDNSKTFQWVDNLTLSKGAHTLKFGADVRKLMDDATSNNWPFGRIEFTSDISGDPEAAFMLGYPRTILTPEGVPITKAREWRYALYAQDDWRTTPKLTLNLGIRWDIFPPSVDVNGITDTLLWDVNPVSPVFWPSPLRVVHNLYYVSNRDFSPRLGFAYRLPFSTVVRGGYGIFYFGGQFDNLNILQLNPPTAGSLTIINPAIGPVATLQNPIPASLYPTTPIFNATTLPAGQFHPDTYVQNWNLTVSKQFGSNNLVEVGYVGDKGTHADTSMNNWNVPSPGPGNIQARRPWPQYANIRMEAFGVDTIYHSLQARYERRFSQGLSFTASYTWEHEIDDYSNSMNNGGCGCPNPRDLQANRGNGLLDQPQNLTLGYVYQLPGKNLRGFTGGLLGGWQTGGIITLATGFPFDVEQAFDSENNGNNWERPNLVAGQGLTLANPGPSLWFNPNAFTSAGYTYGNSPRDPLFGPGTHTFNLSLMKNFRMPFREQQLLQFRAEFFNAFNTPQFANPSGSFGTGTFGHITSTKLDNREIQFALKYIF
ncbi:MAG: carboxypeptidase regulatory-like domain-containing protein, partial [Terriglobia bacterium]